MFFALSNRKSNTIAPGNATLNDGIAYVNMISDTQVEIVTQSGTRYVLDETSESIGTNNNLYVYDEINGGPSFARIARGDKGVRFVQFVLGPTLNKNLVRANGYYGYPTPVANLPATANYSRQDGGTLFLSDGRRLFGGRVNLSADFTNNNISGTVFDNFNKPSSVVNAQVTLNNGTLSNTGVIGGNNLTMVMTNSNTPILNLQSGSGNVTGQIVGTNADRAIGNFSGTMTVVTAGGTTNESYNGVFQGDK